jgi:cell wall-associated NlpC family hydrolase
MGSVSRRLIASPAPEAADLMRRAVLAALAALSVPVGFFGPGAAVANAYDTAFVDVAVATLWERPDVSRTVDEPSLANPVDVRSWLARMGTDERLWLVGKLETQALYGQRVTVLARRGAWVKVAVAGQPTPRSSLGYPGWLPAAQLTYRRPARTGTYAVITRRTAWLYDTGPARERDVELAFNTRLAVLADDGGEWVTVGATAAEPRLVRRSSVALYRRGESVPRPTGADLAATAKMFVGVPYLWAGTSAFAFDCSGFTSTVYKSRGVVIPRDAGAQANRGSPVARNRLRRGDLIFYARSGRIHHVALYVGGGRMIEARRTGTRVRIVPVRTRGYWGARRYVRPAGA